MVWSDVCFQVSLEETEEATPLVWGDRSTGYAVALSVERDTMSISELQGLVLAWEQVGVPL